MPLLDVRQLCIVHLSDLHFGPRHRFRPMSAPDGSQPDRSGYPRLDETLQSYWQQRDAECSVIAAVTGDSTQAASPAQFAELTRFLAALAGSDVVGASLPPDSTFIVPGNHDVAYDGQTTDARWQPYCSFYQSFRNRMVHASQPDALTTVHDRVADLGAVIAEVNSCAFIEKGTPEEQRGQININSLDYLRRQLDEIDPEDLAGSIRVALVHHHPILLPVFAEPSRGYDSIIHADKLLMVLRDYDFHLILHGHKHYPHVFSYDPECAWTTERTRPTVIVAGGSSASLDLPSGANACNTYNEIMVKWNPSADQGRVQVVSHGLETSDEFGREQLPSKWRWVPIRVVDRLIGTSRDVPDRGRVHFSAFAAGPERCHERAREETYAKLRGNMPVVEIIPSFASDQAYDARVWIVPHGSRDVPVEVTWSCGKRFKMQTCKASENQHFAAEFRYYGPMLVQARLTFGDGKTANGHVYARLPGLAG